ncbi:MAG: biopolymer transporter ExbD [Gemmatimonadetes bacterium]|nr:biopolymer transporter ExbD [Gemmatimonadota bacterium]
MARKKKKKELVEAEIDLTPMIDVVFLLLIFFMCTLKFKTLEGKLAAYLPKDVGVNTSEAEPKEKVEIRLTVKLPGTKMSVRNPRRAACVGIVSNAGGWSVTTSNTFSSPDSFFKALTVRIIG